MVPNNPLTPKQSRQPSHHPLHALVSRAAWCRLSDLHWGVQGVVGAVVSPPKGWCGAGTRTVVLQSRPQLQVGARDAPELLSHQVADEGWEGADTTCSYTCTIQGRVVSRCRWS
jgi:hypothetical protein